MARILIRMHRRLSGSHASYKEQKTHPRSKSGDQGHQACRDGRGRTSSSLLINNWKPKGHAKWLQLS